MLFFEVIARFSGTWLPNRPDGNTSDHVAAVSVDRSIPRSEQTKIVPLGATPISVTSASPGTPLTCCHVLPPSDDRYRPPPGLGEQNPPHAPARSPPP